MRYKILLWIRLFIIDEWLKSLASKYNKKGNK